MHRSPVKSHEFAHYFFLLFNCYTFFFFFFRKFYYSINSKGQSMNRFNRISTIKQSIVKLRIDFNVFSADFVLNRNHHLKDNNQNKTQFMLFYKTDIFDSSVVYSHIITNDTLHIVPTNTYTINSLIQSPTHSHHHLFRLDAEQLHI